MSLIGKKMVAGAIILLFLFSNLLIIKSIVPVEASADTWAVKMQMLSEKADATAAVYNDKLYVFGGYRNTAGDTRDETYVYDPMSNTWAQKASMPTARWGAVAVEYNQKIYVFAGQANSGISAYRFSGNPLASIPQYDAFGAVHPDVIYFPEGKDGYKYWMVYTPHPPSSEENPCIVRSNDGIIWTDEGISNPIIPPGNAGDWNDLENPDPDFIYVSDYNKWFMVWDGGDEATNSRKIALAYSSDGKTWTQYDGAPVNGNTNPVILSGTDAESKSWERSSEGVSKVTTPTLFYENGIFYLYYAEEASGNNAGKAGFATFSWNDGTNSIVNFKRYPNNPTIVLPGDDIFYAGVGHLDMSKSNGVYYMYVVRQVADTNSDFELAYLTSTDKISWDYQGRVLKRGATGQWDSQAIYRSAPVVDKDGEVVFFDGKIKLYYSGWLDEVPHIGMATLRISSNSVNEVYDPTTDAWESKADVPSSIAQQGLMGVRYGDKIHLFYAQYHYIYDPSTDSYVEKAEVPTPRTWGTCAVVNDKIYVIGGCTIYEWGASNANEVYDPATDSWHTETPMPHHLYGATRENPVIDGKIIVTHGLDDFDFHHTTFVYDPLTHQWEQKRSAFYARDGVACGVIRNKLYVVGGRADMEGPYGLDYTEEYAPQLSETAVLSVDTIPVKGQVFVNGVPWGTAPVSRSISPGSYVVSFGSVAGYVTPSNQTVMAESNQTVTVTGVYEPILVHDVAVVNVISSSTSVEVGTNVEVNVTIKNNGDFDENIAVIGKCNDIIFDMKNDLILLSKSNMTVSLNWLTSSTGNFTLSAEVPAVQGEGNISDNLLVNGIVSVFPRMHMLTVDSNPIKGITFTLDNLAHATSWTQSLAESSYKVTMPSTWNVGTEVYNFKQWEDNSTNRTRTISLAANTILNATYELYVGPKGIIQGTVSDYSTGNPIVGAMVTAGILYNFTFIDGTYTIEVPIGAYNVTASATGYFSKIQTDIVVTQNTIITLDFALTPMPGIIEGTVIDVITRTPIAGATVKAGALYSSTTNASGYYIITNIPAGIYNITASAPNHKSNTLSNIIVTRNSSTTVNLVLVRIMTWMQTTISDFNTGTKYNVETTTINSSDGDIILRRSLTEDIIFRDDFDDNVLEAGWTVDKPEALSQWIKIDLGSIYSIDTVKVYQSNFPNYYTRDYQIQLSTDDVTFTTVASNALLNSINDVKTNTFTSVNARYVRILITSYYTAGISQGLNEVEVFQTGQPATNLALNKPTTASSQWPNANYYSNRAVDGLKGTTANSSPYPWLCADDAKAMAGNTIEETNGELNIQAFQHTYAHIERSLGLTSNPEWLNVTARIKVSGDVGTTWRPMIALYWATGDWCGIGITRNEFITNLNVYATQSEGFASYSGASPNIYYYVKISLTATSIQYSRSIDGITWVILRTVSRPASYNGPPTLLIVGKGYGNGGWTQGGYTYPNPNLDNSYPGGSGSFTTSYIDDVVVVRKGEGGFPSSGNLTSRAFDAGFVTVWETINWTATLPSETNIMIQTRTGNSSTPDTTWSEWSDFYISSNQTITSPAGRYIQYRVILQTTNTQKTPVFHSVTIVYYAKVS